MKYWIFPLIFLSFFSCKENLNQETINYEDEKILVGRVDWDGLTRAPYNEWFGSYYRDYSVDSFTLSTINDGMEDIEIIMFLGTWCEDSQVQTPPFYKILDHLGFDINKMTVYALERLETMELVSPQEDESAYGIGFVPTMIFLRKGKELGRITEYPELTLERDLVDIISR